MRENITSISMFQNLNFEIFTKIEKNSVVDSFHEKVSQDTLDGRRERSHSFIHLSIGLQPIRHFNIYLKHNKNNESFGRHQEGGGLCSESPRQQRFGRLGQRKTINESFLRSEYCHQKTPAVVTLASIKYFAWFSRLSYDILPLRLLSKKQFG